MIEIVGVLVAHRDGHDAGPDHVGQRVGDGRRIATVGNKARQALGEAKPAFGHSEQQDAAVRGQPAAVEIGCDLPPSDGWKGEGQAYCGAWRAWPARQGAMDWLRHPNPTRHQTLRLRPPASHAPLYE